MLFAITLQYHSNLNSKSSIHSINYPSLINTAIMCQLIIVVILNFFKAPIIKFSNFMLGYVLLFFHLNILPLFNSQKLFIPTHFLQLNFPTTQYLFFLVH